MSAGTHKARPTRPRCAPLVARTCVARGTGDQAMAWLLNLIQRR